MRRAAVISLLAIRAGLLDSATAAAWMAEYESAVPGATFDDWLRNNHRLPAEDLAALDGAFRATPFVCAKCEHAFAGESLLPERYIRCPVCHSTDIKHSLTVEGFDPAAVADLAETPSRPWRPATTVPPVSVTADKPITSTQAIPLSATRAMLRETLFGPGGASASASSVDVPVGEGVNGDDDEPANIGNWAVIKRVGQGRLGTVYQCHNAGLGLFAALKLLPADLAPIANELLHEAHRGFALDHPNVVRVYDFGMFGAQPYLLLEWIEGESAYRRIRRTGPLRESEFLPIAGHVARAVVATHRRGVLHSAISPANIFLIADGTAKMADFGVAAIVSRYRRQRGHPNWADPPGFLAPEQIRGEPATESSDIYALAATFFFLLTSREPFVAPTSQATLHKHLATQFPAVREIVPAVSEPLDLLVQRMGSNRPNERPATMADVVAELDELTAARFAKPSDSSVALSVAFTETEWEPDLADVTVDGFVPRIEIIRVLRHLDAPDCLRLEALIHALMALGVPTFVLDFSGVESMNARGLAALARIVERIRDDEGRLIVAAVPAKIRILFAMLKLDDKLEIADTVEAAKAKLGGGLTGTMPMPPPPPAPPAR